MYGWAPGVAASQAASRRLRFAAALRVTRCNPRRNGLFMAGRRLPAVVAGFSTSNDNAVVKCYIYDQHLSAVFDRHLQGPWAPAAPVPDGKIRGARRHAESRSLPPRPHGLCFPKRPRLRSEPGWPPASDCNQRWRSSTQTGRNDAPAATVEYRRNPHSSAWLRKWAMKPCLSKVVTSPSGMTSVVWKSRSTRRRWRGLSADPSPRGSPPRSGWVSSWGYFLFT